MNNCSSNVWLIFLIIIVYSGYNAIMQVWDIFVLFKSLKVVWRRKQIYEGDGESECMLPMSFKVIPSIYSFLEIFCYILSIFVIIENLNHVLMLFIHVDSYYSWSIALNNKSIYIFNSLFFLIFSHSLSMISCLTVAVKLI